jgi:hypothetical protein
MLTIRYTVLFDIQGSQLYVPSIAFYPDIYIKLLQLSDPNPCRLRIID